MKDEDQRIDEESGLVAAGRMPPSGVDQPPAAAWWEGAPPSWGSYAEPKAAWAPPPLRRAGRTRWVAVGLAVVLVGVLAGVEVALLRGRSALAEPAIAARVDPAVVDLSNTLAGGTGLAAGTGILISSSGLVLTNNHVIAGSGSLIAEVARGGTHPATVVGDDPAADVAVVQVEGVSGLPTVSFADSSALSVGDRVYVIGNALGRGGTPAISSGAIYAEDQTIVASDPLGPPETLTGMIQVSALIQSGDSGGPLVDSNGQVVGVVTAGSPGHGLRPESSPAGYAIPIDRAREIAEQIEAGRPGGAVQIGSGPLLGVVVEDAEGIPDTPVVPGAYVQAVQPDTPAAAVGVVPGDVIVALGGIPISSAQDLSGALRNHRSGQLVRMVWVDGWGGERSATIDLGAGPPA